MTRFNHTFAKASLLLSAALFFSGSAMAHDLDEVYIEDITYGGPGCPQNSLGNILHPNKKKLTLNFSQFLAEVGPGISRREARKFCQIALKLHVPQGWSYAVSSFHQGGWADLDRGVSANLDAMYYLDSEKEIIHHSKVEGPYNKNFLIVDSYEQESLVWSKCGETQTLNFKPSIKLTSRVSRASGAAAFEFLSGKIQTQFGLQWKRCQ